MRIKIVLATTAIIATTEINHKNNNNNNFYILWNASLLRLAFKNDFLGMVWVLVLAHHFGPKHRGLFIISMVVDMLWFRIHLWTKNAYSVATAMIFKFQHCFPMHESKLNKALFQLPPVLHSNLK